jgi:hypothetical protein
MCSNFGRARLILLISITLNEDEGQNEDKGDFMKRFIKFKNQIDELSKV